MSIERGLSFTEIEMILRNRALFRRLVYLSKRLRMKGWSITVDQLIKKCNVKCEISPAAQKNLNKKVQSVCTVDGYFEPNSLCFEMYWIEEIDLRWAVQNGALAVVTKKQIDDLPCIVVENPMEVFAKMCQYFRLLHPNVSTTLVTGSIGKTTTKRMIESVYMQQFRTITNPTNRNLLCYIGYEVQHIPAKIEKMIEEVSEDSPGYAYPSSMACCPRTVVITSIDKSHFEAFGSQEAIAKEICSVTKAMDPNGIVIVNKDDFNNYDLIDAKITTVSITDKTADVYAENIQVVNEGLEFDIVDGSQRFSKVKLFNIYAKHNVLIALYAYAAGKFEGVTPQNIVKGIQSFRTSGIRQNIFRTSDNVLIYADCYNAVAKSIRSAINSAQMIPMSATVRRIAVLGDIEEAGEMSISMHDDVIQCVNESEFDYLLITGKKLRDAYHRATMRNNINVILCDDNNHAIEELKKLNPKSGDLVLFKSSHSGRLDQIMFSIFPEAELLLVEERKKENVWRKKIAIS